MKIHRLTGIDAAFLLMEIPSQPLHSCSLAELDVSAVPGGYSFEKFRAKLAARTEVLPEFRAKLMDSRLNLGTPAWVEDPDFHINRHVHRVELPAPAGRAELCRLAAALVSEPMKRDRPMWDMTFVEGISGTDGRTDRVAALVRTHHVFADGVSSGDLWAKLYDDAPLSTQTAVGGFGHWTSRQVAVHGLAQVAHRPWFFVTRVVPRTVAALLRTTGG